MNKQQKFVIALVVGAVGGILYLGTGALLGWDYHLELVILVLIVNYIMQHIVLGVENFNQAAADDWKSS